jgi:hypothetical protein
MKYLVLLIAQTARCCSPLLGDVDDLHRGLGVGENRSLYGGGLSVFEQMVDLN